MNTPKQQHSDAKIVKWRANTVIQGVAVGAMGLIASSCSNPITAIDRAIDPRGEFVENGDTTNVRSITNPLAIKFLKNMRDVVNRTKKWGGPLEKQSFDNLYIYIDDEVRNIGEDLRVEVTRWPGIQIDTTVSPAGSTPYLDYSATAEKREEGNRHVVISWSSNFTKNGKKISGQVEFINYWEDDRIYMLDGSTGFYTIINKTMFQKAIDESIPRF